MRKWVLTTDDHNNDKKFKDAKELSNSSATRGWGIIVTLDVKRWESLMEKLGILVKDLPVPSGEAEKILKHLYSIFLIMWLHGSIEYYPFFVHTL